MRTKPIPYLFPAVILLISMLACSLGGSATGQPSQPTDTSAPVVEPPVVVATDTATPPPIVHVMLPSAPPAGHDSEVTDRDTSLVAAERRAMGGENFALNLFERPFSTDPMATYFPEIDITRARIYMESPWVYASLKLSGVGTTGLDGTYGVEIDLNVDGRGNVLVLASLPGAQWSTDGVQVWNDTNFDVGSSHPMMTDAPVAGDGYETRVFDAGIGVDPDLAWARISPEDPSTVQIAFKTAALGDDGNFTWGAWALRGQALQPGWFDLNDHFTHEQAGSPLIELSQFYPLKQLAEVDNTCRWGVGFNPTGSEPGVCPVPPTPAPTYITGLAWYDFSQDGIRNGLDYGMAGVGVRLRSGSCGAPGGVVSTTTTDASGNYWFTVAPGSYCVDVPSMPPDANRGSGPVSVSVAMGETGRADFRFWYIIT